MEENIRAVYNYNMIETDFSRRVSRLMHTFIIETQTDSERTAFINAIEQAGNYENMPERYKELINTAESQRTPYDDRFILNIDSKS